MIGVWYRFGEAIKKLLHRIGMYLRQDQREGVVGLGLGGCEDVSKSEALVSRARRALPSRIPEVAHPAFLANAGLVLEEDAQTLFRVLTDDCPQDVRSPF